jgi:hypothetical protein
MRNERSGPAYVLKVVLSSLQFVIWVFKNKSGSLGS